MRPTSHVLLAAGVVLGIGVPALAQAPEPGAAYYFLLGRHHESNGEVEEAVNAYKRAMTLAPESAELHAELGGLYARQDRVADAVEAGERALALDPDNREANRLIGTIYASLAEQRRALRPGDDPARYGPRAIAAFERIRQQGPADIGIDFTLGRLYLQAGAARQAVPLLRRVAAEQQGSADVAILLASAEEAAGDTAAAIATLRTALDGSPRSFRGYVLLAELSEKQAEWAQAAEAYARAQQVNSRGTDLTPRRAAALINAGQPGTASQLLRSDAEAAEASPMVLYLYAVAQRQSGDLKGAEAAARRLRTRAPEDPRGLYVLAQVLESKGDASGAERALRDLLDKHPSDATALNYLGYMFAERGERLDEAVSLVQRALALEPGNPAYLDSLGWAYFQQGHLELADPPLTEAAEKLPGNSVIQDHLGDLRFRQHRFAEAAEAWERSLAGDGDAIDRDRIQKKIRDARSQMDVR